MTYQGHIEKGAVILDQPVDLPDGAKVEIVLVEDQTKADALHPASVARLMAFAGKFPGLPEDASRNLEHYLYGSPKQC